jgi:hypothetical protein
VITFQNKPVATSYLKLGDGKKMPEGAAGGTGAGLNVQDWNQMECRLQYMQVLMRIDIDVDICLHWDEKGLE